MKDLKQYIVNLRHDFSKSTLDESQLHNNPINQFEEWFTRAVNIRAREPNAMMLSTVSPANKPSARILLLRDFSEKGFVFFTNYESKKAKDLEVNPAGCLTFFWPELEQQVRIEGIISKLDDADSDTYFRMRARSSRLGAWASNQSTIIANRGVLDEKMKEVREKFGENEIPRPEFWGGYILKPAYFEFWQGRTSRLHDRLVYELEHENSWKIYRLAP
ncbi:MAG TPA: pyridoxamine 5'-phosphate oxidase [Flavobacteriales bacterium]|nr:pyridoxamine 5'-phosphate oxidase [Flavobacteriales bacterium]